MLRVHGVLVEVAREEEDRRGAELVPRPEDDPREQEEVVQSEVG